MKNRNEKQYNDPWERDYYGTGSTHPPKDRGGLIALLLVAVILLGGTCSALGVINLHLLRQLAQQGPLETLNVFDATQDHSFPTPIGETADSIAFPRLAMEGQTVSDFDRRFYNLPQGVLVTEIGEQGPADLAGFHAGDVIATFSGLAVNTQQELEAALAALPAGTTISVEFYRHQTGQTMETTLSLPEE